MYEAKIVALILLVRDKLKKKVVLVNTHFFRAYTARCRHGLDCTQSQNRTKEVVS